MPNWPQLYPLPRLVCFWLGAAPGRALGGDLETGSDKGKSGSDIICAPVHLSNIPGCNCVSSVTRKEGNVVMATWKLNSTWRSDENLTKLRIS